MVVKYLEREREGLGVLGLHTQGEREGERLVVRDSEKGIGGYGFRKQEMWIRVL